PTLGATVWTDRPDLYGSYVAAETDTLTIEVSTDDATWLPYCTTFPNGPDVWGCQGAGAATVLSPGQNFFRAAATDAILETSYSASHSVIYSTPVAPTITSPIGGSHTNAALPAFAGTGTPGNLVDVYEASSSNYFCTATIDPAG